MPLKNLHRDRYFSLDRPNFFLYLQNTYIRDIQEGKDLQLPVIYKSRYIFTSLHHDYIFSQLYLKKVQNNMDPNAFIV